MEHKKQFSELDNLIRSSMESSEIPSEELNSNLKRSIYQQQAIIRQEKSICSISLWYLPMLLNFVTFMMLAVVSPFIISNPYFSKLLMLLCGYIAVAGVVITIVGIKRTNLKEDITIYIEKRGAMV